MLLPKLILLQSIKMPISHTKKAVFVHIPKTAGTTIEKAFGMQNSESLYCTKYNEKYMVCPQHLYADEILKECPQCKDYFWFAVVRNPFSRLVSEYYYINNSNSRARNFKGLPFNEFIREVFSLSEKDRSFLFDRHLEPQCNFVNTNTTIYKFEQLDNCFADLKCKFGIPFFTHERKRNGDINVQLDSENLKFILEFYHNDFVRFNYEQTDTK
jgi:hypothetical protein